MARKKSDPPGDNYSLKLTQQQRDALVHCTRLKRSIKKKIEQAGEGTQTVPTYLGGWGIHMSLQGGWVWNLWGRECVVIHLQRSTHRVGTDAAEKLAQFVRAKVAANGSNQASKQ